MDQTDFLEVKKCFYSPTFDDREKRIIKNADNIDALFSVLAGHDVSTISFITDRICTYFKYRNMKI